MDNRIRARLTQLIFLTVWLATGCILAAGCSKAVEQKSSPYALQQNVKAAPGAFPREEAVAEKKEDFSASEYEKLGDINFKGGNFEAAFLNYEKAFRISPRDQTVRCKRAWVLVAGNFNSDAASEFEAILAKNENNASALEGLGQAYFQMKRYDHAQEQFQKALTIDSGLWRSRNYLGIIYDHKNQPQQAIQEFLAAIAVEHDQGILYNNLGMAYTLTGNYDDAVPAFRKALDLNSPREKTLNNLGIALAKKGRTDEARAIFIKAGGEAKANNNLGCVFMAQGDYAGAAKSFESAVRSMPESYRQANENLKRCAGPDNN